MKLLDIYSQRVSHIHMEDLEKAAAVKVAIRFRPLNEKEREIESRFNIGLPFEINPRTGKISNRRIEKDDYSFGLLTKFGFIFQTMCSMRDIQQKNCLIQLLEILLMDQ